MKLIALKIDVDTAQAIRSGLPRIIPLLQSRAMGATFFWSLGSERNGQFLRPALGLKKMPGASKISLKQRYGTAALLLGSFRPVRRLEKMVKACVGELKDAGYEHALRPLNRYEWQRGIRQWDASETELAYEKALHCFERIVGEKPVAHAAFGAQMNRTAFRLHQLNGLKFASDCRGLSPFWPIVQGEYLRCVQIPVTLPMLEDLLPEMGTDQAVDEILQLSAVGETHVFNLAADLDANFIPQLERLFDGWLAQGYQVVSLGQMYAGLDLALLPYHHVEQKSIRGRVGEAAVQGEPYP
ncbi:hypothetical protein HQ393_07790 [Chitinibacter bivalviorum]|uniref:Uncharacterized protein n=1 Tax=Chitinibacter bivalviorum TaxID=2739434 RepID=A0A7H9BHR9_9NEIS|nr:hypothetical protein [Chitinibacter bivalviorum]QLG88165.1 hypothetical protein HQ393_07790 [Chitinibacter bivalviorum]